MFRDLCVSVFVGYMISCAKIAEPSEMPFGVSSRVGPRNQEAQIPPHEKGNFGSTSRPTVKYRENPASHVVLNQLFKMFSNVRNKRYH